MFPDPPDLEENKSQMKPLIDEEKDEVLDFSFNQAYKDKSPDNKISP